MLVASQGGVDDTAGSSGFVLSATVGGRWIGWLKEPSKKRLLREGAVGLLPAEKKSKARGGFVSLVSAGEGAVALVGEERRSGRRGRV
ncbi:hypothetical protein D5086_027385 [Populus alba]|uniref:Uncharacterized protein n=1 Tax=Populus alba TaxID=43335 RepID=A0ACC4AVS8_POPAL